MTVSHRSVPEGIARVLHDGRPAVFVSPHLDDAYNGQGVTVDVLNVLGAGDAFSAGFLSGWVRGEEKARLLADARAVAMPSRMETFGIVAVEGFAAATPVVAFAIPSLREVVPEGAGFAVEPFDVEAYAQRLLQVCTDAELALAMGSEGRKFAAVYDWDVLAGKQAEMYRTAAVEVMAR